MDLINVCQVFTQSFDKSFEEEWDGRIITIIYPNFQVSRRLHVIIIL